MTSMALAAQPTEDVGSHPADSDQPSLFLAETVDWQKEVRPWLLKAKPLQLYAEMRGFS
jgi:hypothetical protein